MPSDPTGRFPQGVLVRSAFDFFDDSGGQGGAFYFDQAFTQLAYLAVALYNNATDGRSFKVYGISAISNQNGGCLVYSTTGRIGSLFGPCSPIRADLGAPFGQIYSQTQLVPNTTTPTTLVFGPLVNILGSGNFTPQGWYSPFPLFTVPAGYSLILVNQGAATNAGFGFWYQQANE